MPNPNPRSREQSQEGSSQYRHELDSPPPSLRRLGQWAISSLESLREKVSNSQVTHFKRTDNVGAPATVEFDSSADSVFTSIGKKLFRDFYSRDRDYEGSPEKYLIEDITSTTDQ